MDSDGAGVVPAKRAERRWNTSGWLTVWCFGAGVLLATTAFTGGCSRPHFPGAVFVTGFDFRRYTAAGFLFTPEGYDGPYEAVALLTVTMYPEVTVDPQPSERVLGPGEGRQGDYVIERVDADAGIAKMYEQAIAMGADGVIRFSTRSIEGPPAAIRVNGVEITGFAIRRQSP